MMADQLINGINGALSPKNDLKTCRFPPPKDHVIGAL
jgi:hypothetical protein